MMTTWRTVWMDTANMSGVEEQSYEVNDAGEILQRSDGYRFCVLDSNASSISRPATFNELLSGFYCNDATWHLTKSAAIAAQRKRRLDNYNEAKKLLEAA